MKKVLKFGGSSLADAKQFEKVKNIVEADESRRYVVCSAPGRQFKDDNKVTDLLLMTHQLVSHDLGYEEVFEQIVKKFSNIKDNLGLEMDLEGSFNEIRQKIEAGASKDYLVSRGEYLNGLLLAEYLGYEFVDAADLIHFDDQGRLDVDTTERQISKALSHSERAIVPGFYGSNKEEEIVAFSRGGSDITGSLVADAVDADLYENWTDVPGFLVADPNIVDNPQPMGKVTHKELRELSYMGAPVLHEEAIFPVKRKGINIHIRNTNNPDDPGTLIVNEELENINKGSITGIAGKKGISVFTLEKSWMNLEGGFLRKVITVFDSNEVNIEHIPSSVDSISVVVTNEELAGKAEKIMDELKIYCDPDTITYTEGLSLITIVGHGMASVSGISATMFTGLAKAGVNVSLISQGSSEISIIIGVEEKDFETAVAALYEASTVIEKQ